LTRFSGFAGPGLSPVRAILYAYYNYNSPQSGAILNNPGLAYEKGFISSGQYRMVSEHIQSLERMTGGWLKKL